MKTIGIAVVSLVASCGTKDDAGPAAAGSSCKPLVVTVDGTPLAPMPSGLARSNNMNADITYEVHVFDHDKATCEQLLSKSGRTVPDGEVSVRAFAGGSGMLGHGVAIEAHTQAGGNVKLVSPKPKAAGDIVKICVDNVSFTPKIGSYKDKTVTFTGLLEGKYCGEASHGPE